MLTLITQGLVAQGFSPLEEKQPQPIDDELGEAAILLALTQNQENPGIIFTKRAEHLNSHRGEVAFPGGKWEEGDSDLLATAMRETEEEIGLPPQQVNMIASLPVMKTRHQVRVRPYVGLIPEGLSLVANPAELDAVFEVPVRYLLDPSNLTTDHFVGPDYSLRMPCYIYQSYRIWGFSLVVLTDFLNLTLNAGIHLHYPDRVDLQPKE